LPLALLPQVQEKAHEEIDRVIIDRRGRLPRMSDRADMPYLTQIVWEVFRWAPPVPVTLPHRNRVQDEFDGYILPRDTTMVASLYSITHDLEFHADPEAFDPDRYTDGKKRVPYYVFGYGHRRCPGADMAFAQLFHQASYILSCYKLTPFFDRSGKPLYPPQRWAGEMVRCVASPSFHSPVTPRNTRSGGASSARRARLNVTCAR
ncbi:cytochrome P450, partial [Mycena latifolia]